MVNAVSKAVLATPDNVQPVRHRGDFMGQLEQLHPCFNLFPEKGLWGGHGRFISNVNWLSLQIE